MESLNYQSEINMLNMTITEGRLQDKKLLEEMSIDEYHNELSTYFKYGAKREAAMNGTTAPGEGRRKTRTDGQDKRYQQKDNNNTNTSPKQPPVAREKPEKPVEKTLDGKSTMTSAGIPKPPRGKPRVPKTDSK